MIGEREVEGYSALTLASGASGGIDAAFVPDAGMVGCSLRHRGDELLGQRGGLRTYVAERSTMGIPLLYPWANRLDRTRFTVAGREVNLDAISPPPAVDPNGLPIHGLLAAASGWEVDRHEPVEDGGVVAARFDFSAHDELMAGFPFPHDLLLEATLEGTTLTITTTVRATGDATVPISFGFHPYFRLPGIARSEWEIELPVSEHLVLDRRMIPTGEREPARVESGRLGSRTFDDAYVAPPDSAPIRPRRWRQADRGLVREPGIRYAQVYAPDDDDVVAYEPMTAPTNALVTGGPALPLVAPGDFYDASFSITVIDAPG